MRANLRGRTEDRGHGCSRSCQEKALRRLEEHTVHNIGITVRSKMRDIGSPGESLRNREQPTSSIQKYWLRCGELWNDRKWERGDI